MKKAGKKVEIIFVIVKKRGIYFISLEPLKEYLKNMINSNKWSTVAMQTFF